MVLTLEVMGATLYYIPFLKLSTWIKNLTSVVIRNLERGRNNLAHILKASRFMIPGMG